jgi:hypothetical protein
MHRRLPDRWGGEFGPTYGIPPPLPLRQLELLARLQWQISRLAPLDVDARGGDNCRAEQQFRGWHVTTDREAENRCQDQRLAVDTTTAGVGAGNSRSDPHIWSSSSTENPAERNPGAVRDGQPDSKLALELRCRTDAGVTGGEAWRGVPFCRRQARSGNEAVARPAAMELDPIRGQGRHHRPALHQPNDRNGRDQAAIPRDFRRDRRCLMPVDGFYDSASPIGRHSRKHPPRQSQQSI